MKRNEMINVSAPFGLLVNLYADNGELLRAAYTAMDQTYKTVSPGDNLTWVDNSGNGQPSPFETPSGYKVAAVIDDPAGFGGNKTNAMLAPLIWALMLFSASPIWAKGPLDSESSAFSKQIVSPILIREKLCKAVQDCRDREYFYSTSSDSISYDLYGITDAKVIREIFLAMLNSGLNVSHFRVWRSPYRNKSIFEKPILEFTDNTGSK